MKKILSKIVKTGLILAVTNAMSFVTVGMEKHISGYSNEKAASINSLSAVPIVYDLGFEIGHRTFYGDSNFIKTSEKLIGHRNRIPRNYLNTD
jgi:hypothetical protein